MWGWDTVLSGQAEQIDDSYPDGLEQDSVIFLHTTQNGMHLKLTNCLFLEYSI